MNNVSKIKRLSAAMQLFCSLLITALPIWLIWFWYNYEQNLSALSIANPNVLLDSQYIHIYQPILAAAISALFMLLPLWGLWHLRRLFKLFRSGVFFTEKSVRHMHIFALTIFISALLKPISSALLSVVLTLENPPGQKALAISFGSNEISQIFMAGVLIAVTWILREGQRIASENAEFI